MYFMIAPLGSASAVKTRAQLIRRGASLIPDIRAATIRSTCVMGWPTGGAVEITTGGGLAHADLDGPDPAAAEAVRFPNDSAPAEAVRFLLVLTHGAGGSPSSPDLMAARDAAVGLGGLVARVTQPYRVRGARAPGPPDGQDAAWVEIVAALGALVPGVPLVQGGRSNGARVACRTAAAVGARAVIALAFPLRPPGPRGQSRLPELLAARAGGAAVLVITGERDPFGIPGSQDADQVVVVPGEAHSLRGHRAIIAGAVSDWLPGALR
jgi:predicted alpha/beta-hydrolase family hydrolase